MHGHPAVLPAGSPPAAMCAGAQEREDLQAFLQGNGRLADLATAHVEAVLPLEYLALAEANGVAVAFAPRGVAVRPGCAAVGRPFQADPASWAVMGGAALHPWRRRRMEAHSAGSGGAAGVRQKGRAAWHVVSSCTLRSL